MWHWAHYKNFHKNLQDSFSIYVQHATHYNAFFHLHGNQVIVTCIWKKVHWFLRQFKAKLKWINFFFFFFFFLGFMVTWFCFPVDYSILLLANSYYRVIFNFQSQPFTDLLKIGVLKNFAILTGKHLCWILFLIKLKA